MSKLIIDNVLSLIQRKVLDGYLISEKDAESLVRNLSRTFSFDLSQRYLWENISAKENYIYDNENSSWEILFAGLLQKFGDGIYLVITDDDFYPWPVFYFKKDVVTELLKELQYFEFFIFDMTMKTILFDTHENELLLVS